VVAGGTLYQDVADELRTTITHPANANGRDYLAHEVRVTEGTRLGRAVGRTEIKVNSLHHQAVRDVAPGFMAVAEAPDGVVEAIENPQLPFAMGVQWHPEELYRADDSAANLFRAFVAAAARHHDERKRT
jgi:putative glutamine amidotransferase